MTDVEVLERKETSLEERRAFLNTVPRTIYTKRAFADFIFDFIIISDRKHSPTQEEKEDASYIHRHLTELLRCFMIKHHNNNELSENKEE